MKSSNSPILLIGLYSDLYPAVGESHGISVLAGYLKGVGQIPVEAIDMVPHGRQLTDHAAQMSSKLQPKLIGLSVNYGTFDYAVQLWTLLKKICPSAKFVFGGPLATFLAPDLIKSTSDESVIVVGEGEESLLALATIDVTKKNLSSIPNLVFVNEKGLLVQTPRRPVDLSVCALPLRSIPHSAQVYTESSRGCSWANCTFCLRGLLDIRGSGKEHRQYPLERVVKDINKLVAAGFSSVTFADEDLLGTTEETTLRVLDIFKAIHAETDAQLAIDASLTVNSIFSSRMTKSEITLRQEILRELHELGLRKIFLGIESATNTQLKRYGKSHTKEEIAKTIEIARKSGLIFELGWIPFDPLCDIDELAENFSFLNEYDISSSVSYLFNELRLQPGTKYFKLIKRFESRSRRITISKTLDRNTLSYDYDYQSPNVMQLVSSLRMLAPRIRKIHYPLKNLIRYGFNGAVGCSIDNARKILKNMRIGLCSALADALKYRDISDISNAAQEGISDVLHVTATELHTWLNEVDVTPINAMILNQLKTDVASET